jgi:hypothetical protein
MQLHLVDKKELERRLSSSKNLLNTLPPRDNSVHIGKNGNGTKNAIALPVSLKVITGVLAKTEPTKEICAAFDITPRQIQSRNSEVIAAVNQTTEKIRDLALEKLMSSLGIISDETLSSCSAKDASMVARNLAGVVEKLSPRDQATTQATLVIYAPQQRDERHYQTIDVVAQDK